MKKINLALTIIISLSYIQPIPVIAQVQEESVSETSQTNNSPAQPIYSGNYKESSSNDSSTLTTKTTTDSSLTSFVGEDSVLQEEQTAEESNLLVSPIASGTFGTIEWIIDFEGTLHIGPGEMPAIFALEPWKYYSSDVKKIIIEGKVHPN